MTDDRLREAERQFRATGDVSAETRVLAERVRAGALAKERLELAAALGHEAAIVAIGLPRAQLSHDLSEVFDSLEKFGREVAVRAALVVARECTGARRGLEPIDPCITAVEAWLACPCERHEAALLAFDEQSAHEDAWLAAQTVLGRARPGAVHHAPHFGGRARRFHEPDPPLVFALRRHLIAWALGRDAAASERAATRGTLLDLRIGAFQEARTFRVLSAAESVTLGNDDPEGIVLEGGGIDRSELRRQGAGFELRILDDPRFAWLNDDRVVRSPLATGDVIALNRAWVEVTVHAPPFEPEIEAAREEAARTFAALPGDDRRARVAAAAQCGHLAATLAATEAGVTLRPSFAVTSWIRTLDRLPALPAVAASLTLAREVQGVWRNSFPRDTVLARGLDAAQAWLRVRSNENCETARQLDDELARVVQATRVRGPDSMEPAQAAARVAHAALRAIDSPRNIVGALDSALDAGVPAGRARALVTDELLRWALG